MSELPVPASIFTAVSVLDSLVRIGMRHVVVSPGSRSAPLVYAVAALEEAGVVQTYVRTDERTAGFTALGLAKSLNEPVGIIVTSGTAVGNLMPAVMEADHQGLPLVVLSADRPPRLRGTGANQTTNQVNFFGSHVRATVDLTAYPEGSTGEQTVGFNECLAALTGCDAHVWGNASGTPAGPVQVNCAFDTPLTPNDAAEQILPQWAQSLKEVDRPASVIAADPTVEPWLGSDHLPAEGYRTVVVAGDGAGAIAAEFAQKLGLPLFAEPSSNALFSVNAICAYREVLSESLGQQIERAVVFGHPTLSRPISALLDNADVEKAIYEPAPVAWYAPGRRSEKPYKYIADLARFAGSGHGVSVVGSEQSWLNAWVQAGESRRIEHQQNIDRYRESGENSGRAAALALVQDAWNACREDGASLVVGSSNIIRDLDLGVVSRATSPRVYANRGLAGIDGTIATAIGISLAGESGKERGASKPQKVRLIVGDLTFLHDASSLNIGPLETKPDVEIIVLNDHGGGIFGTLEHGKLGKKPVYKNAVQRYFTTPVDVDLEALARAYASSGISVKIVNV